MKGKMRVPIHRVFPLTELLSAVQEAASEKRNGKVLLDLRGVNADLSTDQCCLRRCGAGASDNSGSTKRG